MATIAANKRQSGTNTSEYQVVQDHFGPLVKKLQHVLPVLACEFFSKGLIGDFELSIANSTSQPAYPRASEVLRSILSKIECDTSYYYKLVDVLEDSDLKDIADDLVTALNEHYTPLVSSANASSIIASPQHPTQDSYTPVASTGVGTVCPPQAAHDHNSPLLHACVVTAEQPLRPLHGIVASGISAGTVYPSQPHSHYPALVSASVASSQPIQNSYSPSNIAPSPTQGRRPPLIPASLLLSQPTQDFYASSVVPASITSPSLPPRPTKRNDVKLDRDSAIDDCGSSKLSPADDTFTPRTKCESPHSFNPLVDAVLNPPTPSTVELIRTSCAASYNSIPLSHSSLAGEDDTQPQTSQHLDGNEVSCYSMNWRKNMNARHGSLSAHCNIEITFLRSRIPYLETTIKHRNAEIELLKSTIEQHEKYFCEESKKSSEQEDFMEKLKIDLAKKNEQVRNLTNEKAAFEKKLNELKVSCMNSKEKQVLAEERTKHAEDKTKHVEKKFEALKKEYEGKIEVLKKQLGEAKQDLVDVHSKLVKAELANDREAKKRKTDCLDEASALQKIKTKIKLEVEKANLAKDTDRAEEVKDLAERANHLLILAEPKQERDDIVLQHLREEMEALNIFTFEEDFFSKLS